MAKEKPNCQLQVELEKAKGLPSEEAFCQLQAHLGKTATSCNCAYSDKHREIDWEQIDKLQAENRRLKNFIGKAVDSAKAYAALGDDNEKMFLKLVEAELKGIDIPVLWKENKNE